MRVFAERTARSMMVTAFGAAALTALTLAPSALAQTAGTTTPASLQNAGSMVEAGRLIEARDTLQRLIAGDTLPTAERAKATALLERVNDRILTADPIEIALQKAELAIRQGDLKTAERQATGVAGAQAPAALQERAQNVLKQVAARRSQLEPMTASMLAQVEKDFNAGQYAKAKQGLTTIVGSGVALSAADQQYVDSFRMRIVDLERARGSSFDSDKINLAVSADSADAEQPADMPKLPPKMPDPYFPPAPEAKPAPAPAPESKPAPAPAPAPVSAPKRAAEPMPEPATERTPAAHPVVAAAPAPVPMPAPAPAPAQPSADTMMRMALVAEAQRAVYEGDAAFADGRYAEAARKYESALGGQRQYLSPEDAAHAQQKLDEAKIRMGSPVAGGLDQQVLTNARVNREKTTAEFESNLAEAKKAIDAGNGVKAMENVNRAKFIVDQNKAYFSQTEYDAMVARADAARADVMAKDDIIKIKEREKAEKDSAEKNKLTQERLRAEKAQKIHESIDRIRTLQREQRYAEALDVCNQVLFMDPQNPTADLLKKILEDLLVYRERDQIQRAKTIGMMRERLDNMDASAPPMGLMVYPPNWPNKTAMRLGAGGYYESDENRRTISALGKEIPVKFANVPFSKALAYIGSTTNVSVDTDWKSLEAIGVDQNTPVSLDLSGTKAEVVLQRILNKVSTDHFNKAAYAVRDGIVTVGSADAIKHQTLTLTYPITDMLLFAPDYTDVPDMNLEHKTGAMGEAYMAKGDPFKMDRASKVPEKRERIRQLVSVIQHSVDPDNWKENGGDVGSVVELNGVLVITNTPENHREITGLLSKLREVRQTQINVEARFLLVNQDFFEQINFDIDMYFNANSNQVTAARGLDPNIVPSNFFNALGIPVTSLDSNVYATGGSATPVLIPPGAVNRAVQNIAPPAQFSPIAVPSNGNLPNSLVPANNSFITGLLNQAPALGIAGRYLDDIQVDFLIKATQADRRTVSLTAPRLTFTNGQIANVVVGTQRAYVSDLTPITGDGSVGFDPVPATLVEGVTLLVEAVASADRRYVTMNIETTVAQLISMEPFTETAAAAGGGIGGGTAVPVTGTFQLPTISASRVQTTVTVPDQGTILLGGQRLTTEVEIETGVPVLSKIPIINRFFTNRIQSRQDQSLLMLVKPTILITSEEEEKAFPGLNDSLRGGQ